MIRLLLFTILLSTPAVAFIGEISEIRGSAGIERGTDSYDAEEGTGIELLDTAVTANATMRIDFLDDTRVDITEHSRLIIDDFVYDPVGGTGSLGLKASLGTIRYASGQIAKNSRQNVKIRTPSATIGVRGTDFVMVVDEVGGSMITLLPSCDIAGSCFVGEITVATDAGFVILNQAFQATMTTTSVAKPSKPLLLDIDEDMINNLLILRKVKPYYEAERAEFERKQEAADFLGLDFLQYDGLDGDALTDSIEGIWVTALDETDLMLGDLLYDMLDQMNLALMAMFMDELSKQNASMLGQVKNMYGLDPNTGIKLENQTPNWVFSRRDYDEGGFVELRLNQSYGYSIDLKQGGWEMYDYRLGNSTSNSINITQAQ